MPKDDDGSIRLSELIAPVFYEVHRDIRRHDHREYMLRGGRGSGKSSYLSIEILWGMMRTPGANAIVYRKVAATLRESVYEQMLWAIDRMGVGGFFEARLSPLEIIYRPTGQRILFRGADDPGKSKSIKCAHGWFGYLWFEEISEFSGMDDVRTIKASVLRGGEGIALYSYNPPQSGSNWINAEAIAVRPDRLLHDSSYLDMPPEWLGESFIAEADALRAANDRAYRHLYLGQITGTGGQVFDNLSLRAVESHEIDPDRLLNGLDFGFAVDPDAFIRVYYDAKRRRLFIADEFRGVRTPADRLAYEVASRAGGDPVRCDSADPRMISMLRGSGVHAVAVKKGAGSVRAGIRFMQDLAEIIIDPACCPHAAREFAGYEYARDGSGGFCADFPDRDNHMIDAARYALEEIISRRNAATMDRGRLGL